MKRSKSTLFLMEQLIVIAVFSVCAAACVKILSSSYFTAKDTRDIGNAILAAESGAESFKAKSGDIGKVAEVLGGTLGSVDGSPAVFVYFGDDWRVCGENDAAYVMRIISRALESGNKRLASGDLAVDRINDHERTLVSFPVSVVTNGRGV